MNRTLFQSTETKLTFKGKLPFVYLCCVVCYRSTSPSTFTTEKLVIRMGDFWKLHRGMPFFCFFFIKHCLFLRFASTCCCKQNKKLATEGDNVIYNQLTAGILQLFKKLLRKKHMLSRLALRISKYDVYMTYPWSVQPRNNDF